MPVNHDYWDETITTVYTDVIEIFEADSQRQPIDPEKIIRLNNSGKVIVVDSKEYNPASFNFSEPDRSSLDDETGSLTIGGVTYDYIEMLNNADQEHLIVIRIGLVDCSAETWVLPKVDYVANDLAVNSVEATIQINFRSGSKQLAFNISKLRYGNMEFPCLFG